MAQRDLWAQPIHFLVLFLVRVAFFLRDLSFKYGCFDLEPHRDLVCWMKLNVGQTEKYEKLKVEVAKMQMLRRAWGVTKDIVRNGCRRKDQRGSCNKNEKRNQGISLNMLWT